LAVDGQGEVAGDDENSLAGQTAVDSDDVVAPTDVAGLVDAVHAGTYWSGDGWTGSGRWACPPAFGGGLAVEGFVWSGVVVVRAPTVELVLQVL
jgi:hypothetical protein